MKSNIALFIAILAMLSCASGPDIRLPSGHRFQNNKPSFWPAVPLFVAFDDDVEPEVVDAELQAIDKFNDIIGCQIFVPTDFAPIADIFVIPHPYTGGQSLLWRDPPINKLCKIKFGSKTSPEYMVNLGIHEMAHCLGLGHSCRICRNGETESRCCKPGDEANVMHPYLHIGAELSDEDIYIIRDLYCVQLDALPIPF